MSMARSPENRATRLVVNLLIVTTTVLLASGITSLAPSVSSVSARFGLRVVALTRAPR